MFERFTDRARTALALAQQEAAGLQHNFIGTEHLLLGLVAEGEGVAGRVLAAEGVTVEAVRQHVAEVIGPSRQYPITDAEALASIGIDLEEVRAAVEDSFGPGALDRPSKKPSQRRIGGPHFVPRAKKVIELALREALSMKHNYIGTEHLLLAILREGEGVACLVLVSHLHLDLVDLRAKVIGELERYRPGA